MAKYPLTGLSIANTACHVITHAQLGGTGIVRNTALAFAGHANGPLGGPWRSIEFVSLDPVFEGIESSVGLHQQQTHEIYFITEGYGVMETNGSSCDVFPGLLSIAPKGTVHTIRNPSPDQPLGFIVVELEAFADDLKPAFVDLSQMRESRGFYSMRVGQKGTIVPRLAGVDLSEYFPDDSAWGTLSVVEIPPGVRVDEYTEIGCDQLLFVVRGFATTFVATSRQTPTEPLDVNHDIPILSSDDGHQSVLVPHGVPRRIENRASGEKYPLLLFCLNIQRSVAKPARYLKAVDFAIRS